jgi:hypothetical protein
MSSIPNADTDGFDAIFAQLARRTRIRLAGRFVLHGGGIGLVGAAAAVLAWTRFAALSSRGAVGFAGVGVGLGVAAALVLARRRSWTDPEVALFFDQKLCTKEAIVTAVELRVPGSARRAALCALRSAPRGAVSVPVIRRSHLGGVLAILLFALATRVPPVHHAARPKAPAEAVVVVKAPALEAVERLAKLSARDDAQRERLAFLAREARKLHDDLAKGLEKREAQDRAARLAESVRNERLTLGAGEERRGLETAIAALERDDATRHAAAALGDHDLASMDRDLERHANAREERDRGRAKKALEDAEQAARAAGAPGVAKAIADERARLEKRAARASALRDLAAAIGGADTKDTLRALDDAPSDANAEALAGALADALSKLSKEEHERLAAKLRETTKHPKNLSAKELEDLAKQASTASGLKQIEQRLREMATERETTSESERDQALGEAQRGAEDMDGELGGGAPKPGPGTSAPSANPAKGSGPKGATPIPGGVGEGEASTGSHHDTGRGNHAGATERLGSSSFKARAHGPLNGASMMPGTTTTWKPGEAGGTADVVGRGALGTVGATEILGTERSEIPEEYREQVHKYFRP